MVEIILRDYQQDLYGKIMYKTNVEKVRKICGVLPTGGGKSVIIGKLANELPGRTLIMTHRREILNQNAEWVDNVGLLASDINTMRYDNKVIIAMVQTLDARIKKYGIEYIGKIDNIILDEIQILIFEKVFSKYNFKVLVGLTATPVLNKKKETNIDGVDFVEPYTLSEIFDDIVIGPTTQQLIDKGRLVQDYNIVLNLPDFDKLKESDSSPDGYTKKSLNEVYSNTASQEMLWKAYSEYSLGKKTLIFNASTEVNKSVLNLFKSKGVNCMMYDSKNTAEINPKTGRKFTREEVIEWFENERDAILINTNVFTTGFNVTDVETIIVNRATKSLSLWQQMAGRGSRPTDKIYKDKFNVIDLGQNIHNHGMWSTDIDWEEYFWPGVRKTKKTIDLLSTWECSSCESLNIKGTEFCEYCGDPKHDVEINGKKKKFKEGELIVLSELPPPKARSIISYTEALGENANFAFKLLDKKIIELFVHYNVSKEFYNKAKNQYVVNGVMKEGFDSRVRKIYTPIYFAILKSELNGKNRKLETQIERLISKIEKLYE